MMATCAGKFEKSIFSLKDTLLYFWDIAETGHADSHAPQSTHASPITYLLSSVALIALAGHVDSHAPHPTQTSLLITYAILQTLPFIFSLNPVLLKERGLQFF